MKLWHIRQDKNNDYDTYSDAVVAAVDEQSARMTHPSCSHDSSGCAKCLDGTFDWVASRDVQVEYLGEAKSDTEAGVICASFHAG